MKAYFYYSQYCDTTFISNRRTYSTNFQSLSVILVFSFLSPISKISILARFDVV